MRQLTRPVGRSTTKRPRRRGEATLGLLLAEAVALSGLLLGPAQSISSLEKVDDFPLWTMRCEGGYLFDLFLTRGVEWPPYQAAERWTIPPECSSFAATNLEGEPLFGRNFDWRHRSSLVLFTDPPGGYASVSTVDLYYLGLEGLREIPWSKRLRLLLAPYATIDGMNEWGVAVAMNSVHAGEAPKLPGRPTLLTAQLMRLILDHARNVDEALALLAKYNVRFPGGDFCHFQLADASGKSVIVEYVRGRRVVVPKKGPWQVSTNFVVSAVSPEQALERCGRYRTASEVLGKTDGRLSEAGAVRLLAAVSQRNTVWSIVYNLVSGDVRIAMGRNYDRIHHFKLDMHPPHER